MIRCTIIISCLFLMNTSFGHIPDIAAYMVWHDRMEKVENKLQSTHQEALKVRSRSVYDLWFYLSRWMKPYPKTIAESIRYQEEGNPYPQTIEEKAQYEAARAPIIKGISKEQVYHLYAWLGATRYTLMLEKSIEREDIPTVHFLHARLTTPYYTESSITGKLGPLSQDYQALDILGSWLSSKES